MSDWRESANRRRDQRQTKLPIIRAPSCSKKNTKRWCRGKVGVEHKPICVVYDDLKNRKVYAPWRVLICSACKKELDHYYPSPFRTLPAPPPAWVCM